MTARIFFYTVYARTDYLDDINRMAWRQAVVKASRGRILDNNDTPLAWTERYFDLYYQGKSLEELKLDSDFIKEIEEAIGPVNISEDDKGVLIKTNLSPGEMVKTDKLKLKYRNLKIVNRTARRYVDYPSVRKYLGALSKESDNPSEGVELEYDLVLKGVDGVCVFMLDPKGRIIPGTLKWKSELKAGSDIKLDVSLQDIMSEAQRGKQ
jgi:cell division protein FtsI/penicillin-binding protein 2